MKECLLGIATPRKAPVDILFAIAKMSDTEDPYFPICMRGWQCGGIVDLESGDPVYECPNGITAVWVSLTERKVYEIDVDFSKVLKEKITRTFQKGFKNKRGETVTYTHLKFSFFPGGIVKLHLLASSKIVSLDYTFQGKETSDYNDDFLTRFGENSVIRSIDDYCDIYYEDEADDVDEDDNTDDEVNVGDVEYDVFEDNLHDDAGFVNELALPSKLWETYYTRFDYRIRFVFDDSESSLYFWSPKFTNSESFSCMRGVNDNVIVKRPSIITSLNLWWRNEDCQYTSFLYFKENEILPLFEKAFNENPNKNGELIIKIYEYNNSFDISLVFGHERYPIRNTEIRVFCDDLEDFSEDCELIYKNYEGNHKNHFSGL